MSNCPVPLPASKNNPWPKVMGANRITPFPRFPIPLSGCLYKANGEDHKSRFNCLSLTASPLNILTPKHALQSQPPPVLHHLLHFGALMWKTRWKNKSLRCYSKKWGRLCSGETRQEAETKTLAELHQSLCWNLTKRRCFPFWDLTRLWCGLW